MGELTEVCIKKIDAITCEVMIKSFRSDSLPNTRLTSSQEIATTGLVILCHLLMQNRKSYILLDTLKKQVRNYHDSLYLKPETTNRFIESAFVKEKNLHDDMDYINVSSLQISEKDRLRLFQAIGEDEGYEWEDDFSINVFHDATILIDILGKKRYDDICPKITINLTFTDTCWLEDIPDKIEDMCLLDSFIVSWLEKEK
ncbi:MAG: hypothetical protein MUC49_04620 [Raineya sp.]|jgi:hypothetical protein|nr:hypothetical protein [Raineya sp.]